MPGRGDYPPQYLTIEDLHAELLRLGLVSSDELGLDFEVRPDPEPRDPGAAVDGDGAD